MSPSQGAGPPAVLFPGHSPPQSGQTSSRCCRYLLTEQVLVLITVNAAALVLLPDTWSVRNEEKYREFTSSSASPSSQRKRAFSFFLKNISGAF